jgi:hypothetical protein
MIYTDETQPQVLVTVNSMPAVCESLACGYAYTEPTSEVSAVSLDGTGLIVSITGTNLPTDASTMTVTIAT